MDYISLGSFRNYSLALRADNKVLIPKEADSAALDLYEDTFVNSNNLLGARYDRVALDKGRQTLIFAQFGKILSTKIENRNSNTSPTERPWDDTGFVLVLEIFETGSAGRFHIIYNLTRKNDREELSDQETYDDRWLLRLCREGTPFTIAQIEGQGLGLLKSTWKTACKDENEIRLAVLSKLRPEIVETGLAKAGDHTRLVALYTN